MKSMFGDYVLTEKQRNSLEKAIENIFGFDVNKSNIRHPIVTLDGYRHVDVIIGEKQDETVLITTGVSARKSKGMPYLEAFAKLKKSNKKAYEIVDFLLRGACFNTSEFPPEYECSLFNGFEYLFVDKDKDFHDLMGYWGVFIVPKFKETISGKEHLFYQLIPAYKEELEFIEAHSNSIDYKQLCEAIVNNIPNRQYFDIKDDVLSEKQLQDIYNSCLTK